MFFILGVIVVFLAKLELMYVTVTIIVWFLSYRRVVDSSGKWLESLCGKPF